MSQLIQSLTTPPNTPTSGKKTIYFDLNGQLRSIDANGNNRPVTNLYNYSTTSQNVASTTRTYITGSQLLVPPTGLLVGARLLWKFNIHKTAAGTATSVFDIAIGTAGTTADTARVSFTKPAGTGAEDEAWVTIEALVRSIGATGVMVGQFNLIHNLAATGHATIPCVTANTVSSGFDMTIANLYLGICVTAGLNDDLTFQQVTAETIYL